ncbi:hypothetical protein RSOLAG22IIIB_05089 [Rhizoctonia solani]|uniref:Uncharacterized protein n=1 Tax=Rhizoctonia solani TaxID=456999 RepID=A0A0K6G3F8_9AGAM|nr:hypothetical protein RSOLAG22IIIB_05089 [Rhizoctonia solani]
MTRPAKVGEILSPEELAACRAYFIIASNNVFDTGLAEPACFRIWLRLLLRAHPTLFGLARTEPSAIVDHEKTRALPSVTPSSTASTTTSVSHSGSPDVTHPSTVPAPERSDIAPPRASTSVALSSASNTAAATPSTTEPPPSKPPTCVAPSHSAKVRTDSQNAAPPASKSPTVPPNAPGGTSATSPSVVTPTQPNPKKSTSAAVLQHPRAAPTTGQIANQPSPVPKPATSSIANPASKPQVSSTTSTTTGDIASQSAPTNIVTQTAARPGLVTRAAGTTSTVAPASGHCVHTTVAPLLHPVALPAVDQQTSIKASAPSALSVSQPSVPMSISETTLRTAVQQRYPALPGLPASLQVRLGSIYEARGEPTHDVYKGFYDILYNFFVKNGGLHRLAAQLSQAPAGSQTGQSGTTPQAEDSNKRKRDDANSRDHSTDEEYRGRNNTSHGSNGGFGEQRSGCGQSTRPKRRKRRRDRYVDYYDDRDDYW